MLKDLISNQKKVYSAHLHPSESVEPLLSNLKRKEKILTAVLLLEGEGNPFPLFIFQDSLYAAYRLEENRLEPLPFSDYFNEMAQAKGVLNLYHISPVLFKALLVLAQMKPKMVAASDIIDNERLLSHIDRDKIEAVFALKKGKQLDLFYFRDGDICDGYFEDMEVGVKKADLRNFFLDYTDFSKKEPALFELYEQISVLPAADQDEAAEQIDSITPSDETLWAMAEGGGNWCLEFLEGKQAGSTIEITKEHVSLGRGKMDIRLNDPQASRHHADIERSQEGLIILDNKSTNGLFVNNEKVTKKQVTINDVIRLGDTLFKIVRKP